MMKREWIRGSNSRVKYVAAVGGPVAVLEVYVCLDMAGLHICQSLL